MTSNVMIIIKSQVGYVFWMNKAVFPLNLRFRISIILPPCHSEVYPSLVHPLHTPKRPGGRTQRSPTGALVAAKERYVERLRGRHTLIASPTSKTAQVLPVHHNFLPRVREYLRWRNPQCPFAITRRAQLGCKHASLYFSFYRFLPVMSIVAVSPATTSRHRNTRSLSRGRVFVFWVGQ